jgi:hypothetical protein
MALVLPGIWVAENFSVYALPGNLMEPFTDASTYEAAGERLNAGHDLYHVETGDRFVLTIPGKFDSPLLSPPPIATAWRPLAASGFGVALWVGACWAALIGALLFVLRRLGVWGALVIVVLSHPIGEQLAVANANSFAPLIYLLAWRYQTGWPTGLLLGTHSIVKLAPFVTSGWLLGSGRRRAVLAMALTIAAWLVVGGIGASFDSYLEYLSSVGRVAPTPWSLAAFFGSWATYAALVGGFVVAFGLARSGRASASFVIAVATAVFATPALYASGLVGLVGALAPWVYRERPHAAARPAMVEIAAQPA